MTATVTRWRPVPGQMDDGPRFLSKPSEERKESTPVSPLEPIRADIDNLFASEARPWRGDVKGGSPGVRLLMQTAVEAEVAEFLAGRARKASVPAPAAVATATARPPSRPPPVRSPSSVPSCRASGASPRRASAAAHDSALVDPAYSGIGDKGRQYPRTADGRGESIGRRNVATAPMYGVATGVEEPLPAWRSGKASTVAGA